MSQTPAGGLSVQTLLISSAAAVVATLVVSQFWEKGTLVFTALVPVVVAVTSELLRRPAERITAVAPKIAPIATPRRAPGGHREPEPERDDPFGLREPEKRPLLDDRRVRLGLVTGLVAFIIGAAFVTLSELTLGGSVGGGDRRTTLLGGSKPSVSEDDRPERDVTPTPTATPGAADPEATPTAVPTVAPSATPTPRPSVTPSATPPPAAAPAPSPIP